jgi:hypothetical protein
VKDCLNSKYIDTQYTIDKSFIHYESDPSTSDIFINSTKTNFSLGYLSYLFNSTLLQCQFNISEEWNNATSLIPFSNLSSIPNGWNASMDMSGLVDSRFDCTKLLTCQVLYFCVLDLKTFFAYHRYILRSKNTKKTTCDGPNEAILKIVTKQCACMVEWFFNAYVSQFLLSTIIYLIVNISRYLLCKGLRMIFWDMLMVPEFEFRGNCLMNGKLLIHANDSKYQLSTIPLHFIEPMTHYRTPKKEIDENQLNQFGDNNLERIEIELNKKNEYQSIKRNTNNSPDTPGRCPSNDDSSSSVSMENDDIQSQQHILKLISFHLKLHKVKGLMLVLISLVINIPWIYVLLYFSENLRGINRS